MRVRLPSPTRAGPSPQALSSAACCIAEHASCLESMSPPIYTHRSCWLRVVSRCSHRQTRSSARRGLAILARVSFQTRLARPQQLAPGPIRAALPSTSSSAGEQAGSANLTAVKAHKRAPVRFSGTTSPSFVLDASSKGFDENPRVSGKRAAAEVRRPDPARHSLLQRR